MTQPDFGIFPLEVMQDHRLTLIETRVLLALLTFRNKTTNLCWPKRAQLADRCGYSPARVSNSVTGLSEKGWLVVERRKSGSRYELKVPDLGTIQEVPEPGTSQVPDLGTSNVPEPGTSLPLTDNRTDHRNISRARARPGDTENPQFQRFRDCWPKGKWTGGRAKPMEFWNRHNLDEIADIIVADVQARTRDDRKWREGFIPNPITYLNQRRWEDDIDTGLSASDEKRKSDSDDWVNGRAGGSAIFGTIKTIDGEVVRDE